jgi:hypothetical protein
MPSLDAGRPPWTTLLAILLLPGCLPASGNRGTAHEGPAILVSIDAISEGILRRTLEPAETPTLHRLFDEGACAEFATPHFPSVTAASHAVLWTGAYGDVNGVAGNLQHRLPRHLNRVLDMARGFSYETLAAEPLWITAGRAGIPVAGHHVTQAPFLPGYPPVEGGRNAWQEERRREARRVLALPDVNVLNGYNTMVEYQRVLTAELVEWTDPGEWRNLDRLGSGVPPRAFRFSAAGHTLFGMVHGENRYSAVTVAPEPDAALGITAHAAPVEAAPFEGRELARHFAGPLRLEVTGDGGESGEWTRANVNLFLRLFEVADDGSDFLLFHPNMPVADGNRPDLMEAYDRAAGGWPGNSGLPSYQRGALGPTLFMGGDGTAEARYLETAEFLTRQFMRGSEWLWRSRSPRLLMDYFPESDAIDHELLGYLDPGWPGYEAARADRVRDFRARVWRLVDLRVAHLLELAEEADGALFVSGDHGMRASWKQFLPNVALRDAGLLALAPDGSIDLSRTRAVSPNGYWISVNREAWREGIVPPEEELTVIEAARSALEGITGPGGERVVVRTFTAVEHPAMGLGGAAGGDLYWATAPGYRSGPGHRAPVAAGPDRLAAGHGFPPDEPDMHTVFCALGKGFTPRRIPGVRTTVVAPTVAEYTGIPSPLDATGSSVLRALQGRDSLPESPF